MKDLNNHFEETNNTVNLTLCLEEVMDEIRVISYLISAVGDSIGSIGVPSDWELLTMSLAQLSFKLFNVAEVLETVQSDLDSKDSDKAADLARQVLARHLPDRNGWTTSNGLRKSKQRRQRNGWQEVRRILRTSAKETFRRILRKVESGC